MLSARNSITCERLIVKRPAKLKETIEFERLSEVAGRTARGNLRPSNKNVFVAMPFRKSNNSRTSINFETSDSSNFNRNNFYNQRNFNKYFKN